MIESCLFSAQDKTGDETHETSKEENSHTESSVINVESPEKLIVNFIDKSSQQGEPE